MLLKKTLMDDVKRNLSSAREAVYGLKMIVNNVTVTPVNNVCRACFSALNYCTTFINLFETKYRYTSVTLFLGSRL